MRDVVTYQTSSGAEINICPRHERELTERREWPKDARGEEYATVSHGLHRGRCGYCDAETSRDILSRMADEIESLSGNQKIMLREGGALVGGRVEDRGEHTANLAHLGQRIRAVLAKSETTGSLDTGEALELLQDVDLLLNGEG